MTAGHSGCLSLCHSTREDSEHSRDALHSAGLGCGGQRKGVVRRGVHPPHLPRDTSRCPISVSILSPAPEGTECASVGGACGMEPGGGRLFSYSVKKMEIQVGKERQEWLSRRSSLSLESWSSTVVSHRVFPQVNMRKESGEGEAVVTSLFPEFRRLFLNQKSQIHFFTQVFPCSALAPLGGLL